MLVSDCFFFQAEDGIRDLVRSRGLGDVYKRQVSSNYPTGLTNYSGTFKLVNESIIFNSTFIISELLWKNDDKILITPEVSLRGQPLNIIMYKNIR